MKVGSMDSVLSELKNLSATTVSDALDRLGIGSQCLGIKPLAPEFRLCGRAFTMRTVPVVGEPGSVGDYIDDVPEALKRVFVTAHDITPYWHMKMQAAFQRHCDASISKTINFPHDATPADVREIYEMAIVLRFAKMCVLRMMSYKSRDKHHNTTLYHFCVLL